MSGLSQTAPEAVLPILAPDGRGEQRRGETEQLDAVGAAPELDAVDDVAPLIRAAHLQAAAVTAGTARRNRRPAAPCS